MVRQSDHAGSDASVLMPSASISYLANSERGEYDRKGEKKEDNYFLYTALILLLHKEVGQRATC